MKSQRIDSLDLLRGLVIVLMALDHVRDYVHIGALTYDPTNLETTTPLLFATRWITHLCAPTFVFLAGLSAYLYATKTNSKGKTAKFLLTRGLWLMFLECALISFLWTFNPDFSFFNLQVIWAIGLSMVVLSGLIFLPFYALLSLSMLIIFGHNFLDPITMQGTEPVSILWYLIHQSAFIQFDNGILISFGYPVLAWIGVMALGFCTGALYTRDFSVKQRQSILLKIAAGMLILFVLIRLLNTFGDLAPWEPQSSTLFTFMSFMNVSKYPPSMLFVLSTLGIAAIFLAYFESARGRLMDWLVVYGRVPFLFYIVHLFLAHLIGSCIATIQGRTWSDMVWTEELFQSGKLLEHGVNLPMTYLVWIAVVVVLYIPCKQYHQYRVENPQKWWLKYL